MVLSVRLTAVLLVVMIFTSVVVDISIAVDHDVWARDAKMDVRNSPAGRYSKMRKEARPKREVPRNNKPFRTKLLKHLEDIKNGKLAWKSWNLNDMGNQDNTLSADNV